MSKIEWSTDEVMRARSEGWKIHFDPDGFEFRKHLLVNNNMLDDDEDVLIYVTNMAEKSLFHLKALCIVNNTPEIFENARKKAVHSAHCCKLCGCKYGDEDCPVVSGEIRSNYKCESEHDFTMTESEVKQAIAQLEIYRNYFHMPEETFYAPTPFKRMLQFQKDRN